MYLEKRSLKFLKQIIIAFEKHNLKIIPALLQNSARILLFRKNRLKCHKQVYLLFKPEHLQHRKDIGFLVLFLIICMNIYHF